jgi:hypothetical protein
MQGNIQVAIYFAVGAYTKRQRERRDAELLKAAASGRSTRATRMPGPQVIVTELGFPIGNFKMVAGVREVVQGDGDLSLIVEKFKLGWPGNDSKGKPRNPKQAFNSWLKTRESKALFGTASATALYAVDLAFEAKSD